MRGREGRGRDRTATRRGTGPVSANLATVGTGVPRAAVFRSADRRPAGSAVVTPIRFPDAAGQGLGVRLPVRPYDDLRTRQPGVRAAAPAGAATRVRPPATATADSSGIAARPATSP
ncbi:hypothetical protein [Streptomyces sp. NPDC057280]|uniref:hypothetical protein n=1 Tax=Streptomyces sp. NPDC057280 TaxID=3346081 RepID=UPI00362BCAE0